MNELAHVWLRFRKILTLGELSQPLETDEEKIVPFACPQQPILPKVPAAVAQSKVAHSSAGILQSTVWATNASGRIMPADRLSNFHRRTNKILLDTVALAKEKERIDAENAKLQDLIGQYLKGTRVDDRILSEENPLFVVNGRYARACLCLYFLVHSL